MNDPSAVEPRHAGAATLLPAAYDELRAVARAHLGRERGDHTLQPTALVHEAWARLARHDAGFRDGAEFRAAAAVAMRRILVDHARRRAAGKRGGAAQRVTLSTSLPAEPRFDAELLELDALIERLASLDARKGRVVELKLFAELGNEDIAALLGVSRATVADDWAVARAWLSAQLRGGARP